MFSYAFHSRKIFPISRHLIASLKRMEISKDDAARSIARNLHSRDTDETVSRSSNDRSLDRSSGRVLACVRRKTRRSIPSVWTAPAVHENCNDSIFYCISTVLIIGGHAPPSIWRFRYQKKNLLLEKSDWNARGWGDEVWRMFQEQVQCSFTLGDRFRAVASKRNKTAAANRPFRSQTRCQIEVKLVDR